MFKIIEENSRKVNKSGWKGKKYKPQIFSVEEIPVRVGGCIFKALAGFFKTNVKNWPETAKMA